MTKTFDMNSGRFRTPGLGIGLLLAVFLAVPGIALSDQYRWTDVSKVVAVSDPHGAYDAFLKTLTNAGVVGEGNNWAGGDTHLVITGDLLDRGADSRKVMDLVISLESQAIESGGMVHLTLGNHEVMNLVGDLRYVAAAEYAAFAEDELADEALVEERSHWFRLFRANRSNEERTELRKEFDRDRPPGFYAHRRAFASDGYYGKWLLAKPVMVVINDTAFVHGGMPPLVADYDLDSLNRELSSQVVDYVSQLEVLNNEFLLDSAVNFYDQLDVAESLSGDSRNSELIVAASNKVIELSGASIHGPSSPLWYRGTVGCSTIVENETLSAGLDALSAKRLVIGHTPTQTRQILQKHNGRVVEIDTGMLSSAYRGSGFALIIEGEKLTVVGENGEMAVPVDHPRRVGIRAPGISQEDLQDILQRGSIVSRNKNEHGQDIVQLGNGDQTVMAVFSAGPRDKDLSPAVAAYRLDGLLGLDMVPVTVARELEGKHGTLQFYPQRVQNEAERAAEGRGSEAWCSLRKQWNAMYIFDTLIYNQRKPETSILYSTDNYQLILAGNSDAFDSKRGKPRHLAAAPLDLDKSWVDALESLTDDRMNQAFADVLDKRRITALSRRRDLLLKEAAEQ